MVKTYTDALGIDTNVFVPKKQSTNNPIKTNTFIDAISNKTHTENGALTNKSTLSAIVDWFYHGAALRNEKDKKRIIYLFANAFNEDKTLALRILFYIRDIRGGQGERSTFRICLDYLANIESEWVKNNLTLIPEYGRWDDCFCLLNTKVRDFVIDFIGKQLEMDIKNYLNKDYTKISLLAKWLPSECTNNKQKKEYFNILINSGKFGSPKAYRKAITLLRNQLNIVERDMCKKEYNNIDYSLVSSNAMSKYSKNRIRNGKAGAFWRNDTDRFKQYLSDVKEGKTINGKVVKINSATLYPYNIVKKYMNGYSIGGNIDLAAEEQWKALPDYVPEINGIVVNDTSGSMYGLPMEVSLSLAVYIAERNKSEIWRNYVIPFSSQAQWKQVRGETLLEKIKSVHTGDCSDTNLQAVFNLILDRAIANKVPDEDMPKQIIIISDMEFNATSNNFTNYEVIKQKYESAGYSLPKMIWWNVNSKNTQTPVTVNNKGNLLLSGCSPAVMKVALGGDYDIMEAILKVTDQERYKNIIYS